MRHTSCFWQTLLLLSKLDNRRRLQCSLKVSVEIMFSGVGGLRTVLVENYDWKYHTWMQCPSVSLEKRNLTDWAERTSKKGAYLRVGETSKDNSGRRMLLSLTVYNTRGPPALRRWELCVPDWTA